MASPPNDARRSKDALVEGDLWAFVKETLPLSDWQKATQHNVDQWLDEAKYAEWLSKRAPVAIQSGPRFRGFDEDKEQVPPSIKRIRSKQVVQVAEAEPVTPDINPSLSPSPSPSPPPSLPPPPPIPQRISTNPYSAWTTTTLARARAQPPPKDECQPHEAHTTPGEPPHPTPSNGVGAPRYHNGHAAFSLYRWQDIKDSVPTDTSSKFSLRTVTWDDQKRAPRSHYRPRLYEETSQTMQSAPHVPRSAGPPVPASRSAGQRAPTPPPAPARVRTPTLHPVDPTPAPPIRIPQIAVQIAPLQPTQPNIPGQRQSSTAGRDHSGKRKRSLSPISRTRTAPKPPTPASSVAPSPTPELSVHMEYPVPVPADAAQATLQKRSTPPSVPTSLSDLLLPNIKRTRPLPKSIPKPPAKGHYEGFCTQFWVDETEDDTAKSGSSPLIKYPKPPQYFPPTPAFPYGLPYGSYLTGGFASPPSAYSQQGYSGPYYYPPGTSQSPSTYPLPGHISQQPTSNGPLWNPYAPTGTVLHPNKPDQPNQPSQASQPTPPSSTLQQSFPTSSQPSAPPVASSSTMALEALKSALSATKNTQPLVTEFYVGPLEKLLPSNRLRKYNPSKLQPGQYPPDFDPQRLKTITYPMRVWKKPENADGYFLDMSKVDDGLWWQPSITGWQSILKIIFYMDRDSWKNVANNTKGPIMSDFFGVAVKWKYYECKGVTYCETLDIDTLIPPKYERVPGDEESFSSKATYPQLARGEEVCAGMVSPAVSQDGDECRFPHTCSSLAKMKSRKCPATAFIMSAAEDVMDHRAVIVFNGNHNHPEFPCLEPMVKPIRKTGWKRWHQEVPVVTSSGFYGNNVPYDAPTGQGSSMSM